MSPHGSQILLILRLQGQVLREENEVRGSEVVGWIRSVDTVRVLGEGVNAYAGLLDCFVLEAETYDSM